MNNEPIRNTSDNSKIGVGMVIGAFMALLLWAGLTVLGGTSNTPPVPPRPTPCVASTCATAPPLNTPILTSKTATPTRLPVSNATATPTRKPVPIGTAIPPIPTIPAPVPSAASTRVSVPVGTPK